MYSDEEVAQRIAAEMFPKEVCIAVMALCAVKLVTSGDEVVLPSSSSGVNITGE